MICRPVYNARMCDQDSSTPVVWPCATPLKVTNVSNTKATTPRPPQSASDSETSSEAPTLQLPCQHARPLVTHTLRIAEATSWTVRALLPSPT